MKKTFISFLTISLVFGHATIPVNHLLDPRRHRLHQVMQEIRFRCPLEPDQEDPPQGQLQHLQLLPDGSQSNPSPPELHVGFNLYRLASDKKFSSENNEISCSSSHIHALLVQTI